MVTDKMLPVVDWSTVTEFENKIAEFFGAPHAVAVDSCTHGLELCLRLNNDSEIVCPENTYLSIPMLANKLGRSLRWRKLLWDKYYCLNNGGNFAIVDGATYWGRNGFLNPHFSTLPTLMCLSFQYQKHLSLGRGGMILCPDEQSASVLRKMSYDGRERGTPWREQDIDTMGYHYYMTPETAGLGLQKLPEAIATPPRIWSYLDYPDVSQFKVFKK